MASAQAETSVTHATPVETRERSRGHGPSRSGPIVPHSLATPLVPQRFQRSDILDLNGYYTLRPSAGRDPRIDATTRNIPVPTGTACEKYRIRCPQTARRLGEYPTRRVVAAVGIFSGAAGRRAAARRRHETRRRGRGARPRLARARLVLTAFLTAGLSRRQTSLKVQACAVL